MGDQVVLEANPRVARDYDSSGQRPDSVGYEVLEPNGKHSPLWWILYMNYNNSIVADNNYSVW